VGRAWGLHGPWRLTGVQGPCRCSIEGARGDGRQKHRHTHTIRLLYDDDCCCDSDSSDALNCVGQWVTGHIGHKTLRHQDTSDPHETFQHRLKTFLHQNCGTRHFSIRSTKSWDTLDQGQFWQDTAPPVMRLKVGAEVSWCRSVLWPKCPAPGQCEYTNSVGYHKICSQISVQFW